MFLETVDFVKANWGTIATGLLVVEQLLAATSLKSNSTFQLVTNVVNFFLARFTNPSNVVPKDVPEDIAKSMTGV